MRAIGSDFGKIGASATIPNRAMSAPEPSPMLQLGSSRKSEPNCNSKPVPWDEAAPGRALTPLIARPLLALRGGPVIERGLFRSGSTSEFAEYLLHKTQFER